MFVTPSPNGCRTFSTRLVFANTFKHKFIKALPLLTASSRTGSLATVASLPRLSRISFLPFSTDGCCETCETLVRITALWPYASSLTLISFSNRFGFSRAFCCTRPHDSRIFQLASNLLSIVFFTKVRSLSSVSMILFASSKATFTSHPSSCSSPFSSTKLRALTGKSFSNLPNSLTIVYNLSFQSPPRTSVPHGGLSFQSFSSPIFHNLSFLLSQSLPRTFAPYGDFSLISRATWNFRPVRR